MSQETYNIINQTFPQFRQNLNDVLAAIEGFNSGASAPSDTAPYKMYANTSDGFMYIRNAADNAWIKLFKLANQGLISQNCAAIYAADAGSTDAYVVALSPAITSYTAGQLVIFKANTLNTGAATLDAGGGAKVLKKFNGTDVITGDIAANQIIAALYNATSDWWDIISPLGTSVPASSDFGILAGGRLTLTSGVPVLVSDTTAATTIYYTPYIHNIVEIYNGTNWLRYNIGELSNVTSNSSTGKAGPAAVANNSNYDLFVWNDSGTIRLTRGPAWTGDNTRGTGAGTTELQYVNGRLVNNNAITNGPGALLGTYVGTVRSNGSAQIDVKFGASPAANGSDAIIGVWNNYNRVLVSAMSMDNTNSWAYTTASYRQKNGQTSNRVRVIRGFAEDHLSAVLNHAANTSSGTVDTVGAIGINSTTVTSGSLGYMSTGTTIGQRTAFFGGVLGLGLIAINELELGGANATFYGDNGGSNLQTGLSVTTRF